MPDDVRAAGFFKRRYSERGLVSERHRRIATPRRSFAVTMEVDCTHVKPRLQGFRETIPLPCRARARMQQHYGGLMGLNVAHIVPVLCKPTKWLTTLEAATVANQDASGLGRTRHLGGDRHQLTAVEPEVAQYARVQSAQSRISRSRVLPVLPLRDHTTREAADSAKRLSQNVPYAAGAVRLCEALELKAA